jgi:hypothetical protein
MVVSAFLLRSNKADDAKQQQQQQQEASDPPAWRQRVDAADGSTGEEAVRNNWRQALEESGSGASGSGGSSSSGAPPDHPRQQHYFSASAPYAVTSDRPAPLPSTRPGAAAAPAYSRDSYSSLASRPPTLPTPTPTSLPRARYEAPTSPATLQHDDPDGSLATEYVIKLPPGSSTSRFARAASELYEEPMLRKLLSDDLQDQLQRIKDGSTVETRINELAGGFMGCRPGVHAHACACVHTDTHRSSGGTPARMAALSGVQGKGPQDPCGTTVSM